MSIFGDLADFNAWMIDFINVAIYYAIRNFYQSK